jgi:4a-hydroxytetrahydrobiopterin dehydratase
MALFFHQNFKHKGILKMKLKQLSCEPCDKNAHKAERDEKTEFMLQLPRWQIVTEQSIEKLKREYVFNTFLESMAFTNKVAVLAEEFNHHPEMITQWGKATVIWWTHSINGLHKNDFILAAKTDHLY